MHTLRLLSRLSLIVGSSLPVLLGAPGCSSDEQGSSCQRALPAPTQGTTYCHTKSECPSGEGYVCTAEEPSLLGCDGVGQPPCTSDEQCSTLFVEKRVCDSTCKAPCESDMACGPIRVCDVATGHCGARTCNDSQPCPPEGFCGQTGTCQVKQCDPAVTSSCGVAQVCDPVKFACVSAPCSGDSECPELFSCQSGACGPRACTCDGECGSGYCIRGTCDATAGSCQTLAVCGRPLQVEGGTRVASLAASSAWG